MKSISTVKGCLFEYLTGVSSTSWWQGILSGSKEFVIKTGSNGLTIKPTGDTSISGNLDVGGIMNTTHINLTNDDPNIFPLAITHTGANWFQGEYISTANQVGCLFRYKTTGSSTYWWSGVWSSNTNYVNIWLNYKGLSIESNGSAAISGNLNVGVGATSSTIDSHSNQQG